MENQKIENQENNVLEQLVENAESVKETNFSKFVMDRFREKADLRLISKLFIANELDLISKHVRVLKKTRKLYEELNRDISNANTEQDIIDILGPESALVKEWLNIKSAK